MARIAVIDALDPQYVDRLPDIVGRALLAGMGHQAEPRVPGPLEDAGEVPRGMADLRGIEADADDPILVVKGEIEGRLRVGLVEMAQEAHDEMARDAEVALRFVEGALQPVDHRPERDPALEMSLGIEEDLDMAQTLAPDLGEIGGGEIVEILLGPQHRHALIVEIEEILQPGEIVGLAERRDGQVGQSETIAGGEPEHELRLEAALDMDMQLALGQPSDEACQIAHACGLANTTRGTAGYAPVIHPRTENCRPRSRDLGNGAVR